MKSQQMMNNDLINKALFLRFIYFVLERQYAWDHCRWRVKDGRLE
jgi:hypothetical protein